MKRLQRVLIFVAVAGLLLAGALPAVPAWADERVEVITYVPANSSGSFDRLHANRATIGPAYSLTNPTNANLPNGTLLVWNRVGIGMGATLFAASPPTRRLWVQGPDDAIGVAAFMPGIDNPPLGDTDMRVGIGTDNPGAELEVVSPTDAVFGRWWGAVDADNSFAGLELRSREATNKTFQIVHKKGITTGGFPPVVEEPNNLDIFYNDGTSWFRRLRMDDRGFVGINTNKPEALLMVRDPNASTTLTNFTNAITNAGFVIQTKWTLNAFTPGLFWAMTPDVTATRQPVAGIYLQEKFASAGFGVDMHFGVCDGTVTGINVDAMTINRTGAVGIGTGTTAPGSRLEVRGTGTTSATSSLNALDSGGTSMLFVRNDGNVGVGLNTPGSRLEIKGTGSGVSALTGGLNVTDSTGASTLYVRDDGRVGIKTTNPGYALEVTGDAAKSSGGATWIIGSDARLKTDIQPLQGALGKLLQLRGVTFEWKEPAKHGGRTGPQMGMTAQDVEKAFPEWVGTGSDGYKTVGYVGLEAVMVEAIRDLKSKNDLLKQKNKELEERIRRLEEEIHASK